tara:strand:+ start:980 stop:1183 length:204 start_codon:yes stop_codon:yes gene_type:complete
MGRPKKIQAYEMMDQSMWNDALNSLREKGTMNMFAAPTYLVRSFNIKKDDATHIFKEWTKTYETNGN